VGERTRLTQAPDGAKEICAGWCLSPLPGHWSLDDQTHDFTVGYYLTRLGH
jgi:hypothetical protein